MLTACTLSYKSCAILRELKGLPPLGGINSAVITLDLFSKVCWSFDFNCFCFL